MEPLGASGTWEWHGYRNSYVAIDGVEMQSVSGGGHWGGGVWISTRDHARFGYLHLRRGLWRDRRLLSERWLDLTTAPCEVNPSYGCLWWLNTRRGHLPSAPETRLLRSGRRPERGLGRSGPRPGGRRPLDSAGRPGRLHRSRPRGRARLRAAARSGRRGRPSPGTVIRWHRGTRPARERRRRAGGAHLTLGARTTTDRAESARSSRRERQAPEERTGEESTGADRLSPPNMCTLQGAPGRSSASRAVER